MKIKLLLFAIFISTLFAACNKDEELTFDPAAKLSFSSDSVLFDTVFTSIGSSSRRLKIYNPNGKAIHIDNIKLSGGVNSPFSLNINGLAAAEANNLKLNGKDSLNIFVKVQINPTVQHLPFIVEDSILLYFNGKKERIPLVAFGQNANFVNGATIASNTTWNSKLPYLIYKSVTIAKNATLTIEPGTKVLFHGNASMSIKGTLNAIGTRTDSILFAGDRLEKLYRDQSGQWNGLHFYPESTDSQLHYTIIKNGVTGITVDSLGTNGAPKVLLTNSIVKNMEVVGFLGYQAAFTAFNNLFYNCGQYLLYGAGGGSYNLKQNTFVGYNPNFARKTPIIYLSDYISTSQSANLSITVVNNIIWGTLKDEFSIDKKTATSIITSDIKNNLLTTTNTSYNSNGNILNQAPLFISIEKADFRLGPSSPVLNKGANLTGDLYFSSYLNRDLANKSRLFPSELGCYENN
ncbi:MAG: hypothetical protein REI78_07765 [Pedobacter sp.]|nr:hypothetical protein [Pedobacter sp.]MDQ8052908.1 hypothetical protein [Pedobacter sp.]